jgi:hypothetical protein
LIDRGGSLVAAERVDRSDGFGDDKGVKIILVDLDLGTGDT